MFFAFQEVSRAESAEGLWEKAEKSPRTREEGRRGESSEIVQDCAQDVAQVDLTGGSARWCPGNRPFSPQSARFHLGIAAKETLPIAILVI